MSSPPRSSASIAPLAKAVGLRTITIFGGVGANPQISGLRAGVDIVVACPGRLEDHLKSGHVHLDAIEITVLDEADHMADLGFLPVVRRLLDKTPRDGQRMLFSATLDGGIDVLVKRFLQQPGHPQRRLGPVAGLRDGAPRAAREERGPAARARRPDLGAGPHPGVHPHQARRQDADPPADRLRACPRSSCTATSRRTPAPATSRRSRTASAKTLVATDIAARGIHVDDIRLVIHADPPIEHKAYLHRSGRTARAGADGTVVTLMTDAQVSDVRDLTRKAGIVADHDPAPDRAPAARRAGTW